MHSAKQTHGYHCQACGALWDAYQIPCPMEEAIRHMEANATCVGCSSRRIVVLMPYRYEEMKAAMRMAEAT